MKNEAQKPLKRYSLTEIKQMRGKTNWARLFVEERTQLPGKSPRTPNKSGAR